MTTHEIIDGKFARVSVGNGNWEWLPEGDDLQERVNARCDAYWRGDRDAPLAERNVEGWAVKTVSGTVTHYALYTTAKAARNAIDPEYQAAMAKAKQRSGVEWR